MSLGTSTPESIYQANFTAEIEAISPVEGRLDCEVQLPLPPQIISLSDLTFTVNGEPSDSIVTRDGLLVWSGQLDPVKPAPIKVTYSAMGKGIYTLNKPPGKIVDLFDVSLTANNTNLQMLELSLQPSSLKRESGNTIYTWKYNRLMLAQPIAVDVLGIAPMDRLGELGWLGPVSVLIFGLLVALVGMAFRPEKLDKWMLLLIVGTFTAAYPLMYFTQEFVSLTAAMIVSSAAVLAIIAVRAVTLMGVRVGVAGVIVPAIAILAVTLWATVEPSLQGVLLTILGIGTFVLCMVLLPKAQRSMAQMAPASKPPVRTPPPAERPSQDIGFPSA